MCHWKTRPSGLCKEERQHTPSRSRSALVVPCKNAANSSTTPRWMCSGLSKSILRALCMTQWWNGASVVACAYGPFPHAPSASGDEVPFGTLVAASAALCARRVSNPIMRWPREGMMYEYLCDTTRFWISRCSFFHKFWRSLDQFWFWRFGWGDN